jgi:hypothetical protein
MIPVVKLQILDAIVFGPQAETDLSIPSASAEVWSQVKTQCPVTHTQITVLNIGQRLYRSL